MRAVLFAADSAVGIMRIAATVLLIQRYAQAPMLRVPDELAGGHDYQEFIGAKKHLVLRLLSQNGPQGSKSFATGS